MQRVEGVIQHYAWGDPAAIADLRGVEPDGELQAELWFGTHPGGASHLADGRPLESTAGPLPYLVKVLAARTPLSLQVHPSMSQAEAGYAREDAAGLPLDAPQRNYRDRMHKPELLCALTPFEAVCGIAPIEQTDRLLGELGAPAASIRTVLGHAGVNGAIGMLLHDRPDLSALVATAQQHPDPRCTWLVRAAEMYPGDPSAAILLLLNHVAMQPGDAIFLGAGNLHAYLCGMGVEVMAASDNVLRCGLTTKFVDAEEVLRVLDDTPLADPLVHAVARPDEGLDYPVPVPDFRVARYEIDGAAAWTAEGPELALCTHGEFGPVSRGQCVFATDGEPVQLRGRGTVFRVGGR
jgi:mannose-6-phosphate isomerase